MDDHHNAPHLVIYPGESTTSIKYTSADDPTVTHKMVTMGTIYCFVGDDVADHYPMAGGPKPGSKSDDGSGHTIGSTPHGHYVLGRREHHTTVNWVYSAIPWGARVRATGSRVEFNGGSGWRAANGRDGVVTRAVLRAAQLQGKPITVDVASELARKVFYRHGKLIEVWLLNDFGKWSWNLMRHHSRTAYYIHTTPDNESATAAKHEVELDNSHGCVHIKPNDRDAMMKQGYLKEGIRVTIKPYGLSGKHLLHKRRPVVAALLPHSSGSVLGTSTPPNIAHPTRTPRLW